jgi:hypothetical protein
MGLSGSLSDFDLSYIVQIISQESKTGKLVLQTDGMRGLLVFAAGKIVYAGDGGMELADMIMRFCAEIKNCPASRLRSLRKECGPHPARFAAELVKRDVCSAHELHRLCETGLEDLACELFLWENGQYHFEVLADVSGFRIHDRALAPDAVMMEAARRADEWRHMGQTIHETAVFIRSEQSPYAGSRDAALDNTREYVYSRVDGSSSTAYLCETSFLTKYRIFEALDELLKEGAVSPLSPKLSRSINAALRRTDPAETAGLSETVAASIATAVFIAVLALVGLGLIRGVWLADAVDAARQRSQQVRRVQNERKIAIASLRYHAWGRTPLSQTEELIDKGYLSPRDLPTGY